MQKMKSRTAAASNPTSGMAAEFHSDIQSMWSTSDLAATVPTSSGAGNPAETANSRAFCIFRAGETDNALTCGDNRLISGTTKSKPQTRSKLRQIIAVGALTGQLIDHLR